MNTENNKAFCDFLIKTGHELVNIMTPLEHIEYLEDEVVAARVARGERLGKTLGRIARMINCEKSAETYDFTEFVPSTSSLPWRSPTEIPDCCIPRAKFVVPSIGSTIQLIGFEKSCSCSSSP